MEFTETGSCQCGHVGYQITSEPIVTYACHCTDCQVLSTSAFSITMLLKREAFELSSGDLKSIQRPTAAGGIAVCWFCPKCGNRIYHENPDLPAIIRFKPSTLKNAARFQPEVHIWTCREQPWLSQISDHRRLERQPSPSEAAKAIMEGNSPF